GSRVVGLLLRSDVMRALAHPARPVPPSAEAEASGEPPQADHMAAQEAPAADALVRDVMRSDPPVVHEGDMLDRVHGQMQESGLSSLPVLRGDPPRLVGLITLENVGEWMMIRSAAVGRGRRRMKDEG